MDRLLLLFSISNERNNERTNERTNKQVVPKPLAVVELPAFPKPPNVVAAEERERKRKEREGGVAAIADAKSLEAHCYGLPAVS